jgi:biotin transporter BioY
MDFIAGLVVGFVIGFMLALFLFSWLTARSESENEPELSHGTAALSRCHGHGRRGWVVARLLSGTGLFE